jgi:hypothetical protein
MGKIKVGGIKLSRELVQVDVTGQVEGGLPAAWLLSLMAEQKINLTYLSASFTHQPAAASFCVAASDFDHVQRLIDSQPDLGQRVRTKTPVGALTVFPHRSDLRMLGLLLTTLSKAGCPIYGMASSISTLTLNTNYWLIGRALQALESVLELPLNHSPYMQEFLVRQL